MKIEIYNYIKEALREVTGLKYVGRWKNQLQADKIINPTPAAYIEIAPVSYEDMTRRKQVADNITFVIHLVIEKYTTEDTDDAAIYEMSQAIFVKLQSLKNVSRINESMDVTNEKLEDFQLTYVLSRIEDVDAIHETTTETVTINLDTDD